MKKPMEYSHTDIGQECFRDCPPIMASIHTPILSSHLYHVADLSRKQANAPHPRSFQQELPPVVLPGPSLSDTDSFYGHEVIARICCRFITHLFHCPELPASLTNNSHQKLSHFIAYTLHRTKVHQSVTFAALLLLQRLKARFPTARGSSGHRLFISALMVASKVICDDNYSNKSWIVVAQDMFTLRKLNQMERDMCNFLGWELTVNNVILANFETAVKWDFRESKDPFPNFPLFMVSNRGATALTSATPMPEPNSLSIVSNREAMASTSAMPMPEPNFTMSPISKFGQQQQHHSLPATTTLYDMPNSSPSSVSWGIGTPDTPSFSYSISSSPASSIWPSTPVGNEDYNAKIQDYDASPDFSLTEVMGLLHPLKDQMFTAVQPSHW